MSIKEIFEEQERKRLRAEKRRMKKSTLDGWVNPNVKPEKEMTGKEFLDSLMDLFKSLADVDQVIADKLKLFDQRLTELEKAITVKPGEEPHWVETVSYEKDEMVINTDLGYKLIINKVIHTPKSTKLLVTEVRGGLEYEEKSMVFANSFFSDDFNYLCDMIKEQIEHKLKAGYEIDLKTLFKVVL